MAAVDQFDNTKVSIIQGAVGGFTITPHDTNELAYVTRGICFATAGALVVVMENGNNLTIPSGALAAGIIHPIRVKQILNTGTTAAGIVGWL